MRHVAAYLLATVSDDRAVPSAEKIKSILGSVGVEADDKQLEIVLQKFSGKSPANLIENGSFLLASMPSGGGGAAPVASSAAPAAAKETAKEVKKEEKKEEPEEESDEDMGFGLFE